MAPDLRRTLSHNTPAYKLSIREYAVMVDYNGNKSALGVTQAKEAEDRLVWPDRRSMIPPVTEF